MVKEIRIPLINPNEPQALITEIFVEEGQHVTAGDVICTLETTKSTEELVVESDGYVVGLLFERGQSAHAGDVLCYLADAPDWQPPTIESYAAEGDE